MKFETINISLGKVVQIIKNKKIGIICNESIENNKYKFGIYLGDDYVYANKDEFEYINPTVISIKNACLSDYPKDENKFEEIDVLLSDIFFQKVFMVNSEEKEILDYVTKLHKLIFRLAEIVKEKLC